MARQRRLVAPWDSSPTRDAGPTRFPASLRTLMVPSGPIVFRPPVQNPNWAGESGSPAQDRAQRGEPHCRIRRSSRCPTPSDQGPRCALPDTASLDLWPKPYLSRYAPHRHCPTRSALSAGCACQVAGCPTRRELRVLACPWRLPHVGPPPERAPLTDHSYSSSTAGSLLIPRPHR